ncbi:hypothetical protein C7212DRAFT_347669 [Tuber magnatum]|uniref:SAP domain-containing protein n=1 Tax=Tuber magnatum TaxID=42249 RepID=A0A317SGL2_9PEZI|nr:hypothetical protein C7212DRAFT_347668 [Tuber magnatum]PWW72857.1 hypothetical protein C7212DRAFT_347669 [Tuber magnatum]
MAPTKKQLLQVECRDLGLSSTGTVAQLTERIDNQKKSKQISSKDKDDPMCDAILVTQSMLGDEDYMKIQAKAAFEQELEKEDLEVGHVREEVYVGNRRGLDLAGMKAKLDLLETEVKDLKSDAKELRARVATLSLAAQDYKWVRPRFISTFKQIKLPDQMEESDYDVIRNSNSIAHGVDAAVDAWLYEGIGGRKDIYAFQQLYGLHLSDVRMIKHQETLKILDIHAEVRAHNQKTGTNEFYQKFAAFILAFQKSNLNTDYLIDDAANATRAAYGALLKCSRYRDGE